VETPSQIEPFLHRRQPIIFL